MVTARRLLPAGVLALSLLVAGCASHAAAPTAAPLDTTPSHEPTTAAPTVRPHVAVATCPLTGTAAPGGHVPQRPALAVKVEDLPVARPQSGLDHADVVYEEPVEDMITRFVVVYQCFDAARVEPVRSARLVDPDLLVQYGHPALAHAGGIDPVLAKIHRAGITDLDVINGASAYGHRDPDRSAPHNLYTSTTALYSALRPATPPTPVFRYSATPPAAPSARWVHVPFSGWSDVTWRFDPVHHRYLRYYGDRLDRLADGAAVDAANVVVQQVVLTVSGYVEDAVGSHEWDVHLVGSGPAWVLRDGRVVRGRWVRPRLGSVTRFVDAAGHDIPLRPGRTWVELAPTTVRVSTG